MKRCSALIVILLALSLAGMVAAQVGEEMRFAPKHRVYFPRWVWQGVQAHIVVVVINTRDQEWTHTVELDVQERAAERFVIPDQSELKRIVTIPPHSEKRVAFPGIKARKGVEPGPGIFLVKVDDHALEPSCFIKTVRGTLAPSKRGSLAILVTLATVWCVVVAVAMRFLARPGLWREPYVVIPDQEQNVDEEATENHADNG